MPNSEKKIPKSLKDCYATDNVSSNLWNWSNWLEVWGGRVLIILIIIGIISTIGDAREISIIDEDLVFMTVISSITTWVLYAFIEYCAYNALSLLIAALATIVQNTKITANIALYNTAKEEGLLDKEDESSTATQKAVSSSPKSANTGPWICRKCGTKNDANNLYCKDCGTYK